MRPLAAAAVMLAGAASAAPPPQLDMVQFFSGRTHAEGVLKIVLKRPAKMIVDSVGGRNAKGEFVLIDKVRQEGQPLRERRWVMRPAGPNRYTGTLSDAVGPVRIEVSGNAATIDYVMKGGLNVHQRMELQGDKRTLANHVTVRKLGMKFARMEMTIHKLD